jgi:hypothetical protein
MRNGILLALVPPVTAPTKLLMAILMLLPGGLLVLPLLWLARRREAARAARLADAATTPAGVLVSQ